jgi:general transcriptional corepressor CYC8
MKTLWRYFLLTKCFNYILSCPPSPLTELDILFQIGHLHEQHKEYQAAKEAYEHVIQKSPKHAKVLQQLGWLHHQQGTGFTNQDLAISYLNKSSEVGILT